MLCFAEEKLIEAIGAFSPVGGLVNIGGFSGSRYRSQIDINFNQLNSANIIPGQCQAFLTTSRKFVWFVEQWDVVPKSINETSFEVPAVSLQNKKVYPAKVSGLGLPLLGLSNTPTSVTVRWREGLIRHGSYYTVASDKNVPCMRPGFGETITGDLRRTLESETSVTNNLGLNGAFANSLLFWGPLGRLISMAFYVDPEMAKLYDASTSSKKKKSLNSQDYEEIPTYPTYKPYARTGY